MIAITLQYCNKNIKLEFLKKWMTRVHVSFRFVVAEMSGGWLVPGDWTEWNTSCEHGQRETMDTCLFGDCQGDPPPHEVDIRYIPCPSKHSPCRRRNVIAIVTDIKKFKIIS